MPGLVVVGASLAGLRAVEAARKAGFRGAVTLIGAEPHLPYDRPPLSKAYLGGEAAAPTFRAERVLTEELGVELLLATPATGLDPDGRRVLTADRAVPYDALVLATGATARRLPDAWHMPGVHTLRTIEDAEAIRSGLDAGARTVVVGAGFIGSEVASAARARGLDVTVVEAARTPVASAVGEAMGEACASLHHRHGVDLRCGVAVADVVGESRVEKVLLSDGSSIAADLVVVGIGAAPATGWLDGGGLHLDDGVVCDETLATDLDGVYAAGDVARWHNPLFGRSMRLEHWTSAAEQGATAARNALDPARAAPYQTVPYFWSDWLDSRIQFVGVPEADQVEVVDGEAGQSHRWVALYRAGDRLIGALAVNGQNVIMKYRALIARRAIWQDALAFACARR